MWNHFDDPGEFMEERVRDVGNGMDLGDGMDICHSPKPLVLSMVLIEDFQVAIVPMDFPPNKPQFHLPSIIEARRVNLPTEDLIAYNKSNL